MHELDGILQNATKRIEGKYFHLPIADREPIYRERVYCYELYHQMRCHWPGPDVTPFSINGEVDKQGHYNFAGTLAARAIPDLLVHVPGDMRGNHAVIEVKSTGARNGLTKDLRMLTAFQQRNIGYERSIYLIYGNASEDAVWRRIGKAARQVEDIGRIEVWFHNEVGEPARRIALI